jgi:cell division protein FtsI (penicillin-binding protein 3)
MYYEKNKEVKIVIVFIMIFILTVTLIIALFSIKKSSKNTPNLNKKRKVTSVVRGSILSKDGSFLSISRPEYRAKIYKRYLDTQKQDIFIELFSKYSGLDPLEIEDRLLQSSNGVVLSTSIDPTRAKLLQDLRYDLAYLKIFHPLEKYGYIRGLDLEDEKEYREYPLKETLSPYIGYTHYDKYGKPYGKYGLELYYENLLQNRTDTILSGQKDRDGVIIRDKDNINITKNSGYDIVTNIDLNLQQDIERILDRQQARIGSKEIIAAVMESKTGRIISVASTNRYNPSAIKSSDIPNLTISAIRYPYEPGSVMKPIMLSMLLEDKRVKLSNIIDTNSGRYRYKSGKVVKDEHPYPRLSVKNIIVKSSNVGMIKLSHLATPLKSLDYLNRFGFSHNSGIDLSYEQSGSLPTLRDMQHTIVKAVLFYGYGLRSNFFQLLKAYNVFNNDGRIVTPRIARFKVLQDGRAEPIVAIKSKRVLSKAVSNDINSVLQSVVRYGTAKGAFIDGLVIGGKTGTSEIPNRDTKAYNSSFFGFANDTKSKYTIGVTVIEPDPKSPVHFASKSAVPTFKDIVDSLVKNGLLKPEK